MTQIQPHPLWIGHKGDGDDLRRIFDKGIKAIIDLALEERPTPPPRELIYGRFPLLDGVGNRGELLFLAISTVATLLKMHVPLLVICGGGVSRSPAVAAAALAMVDNETPETCLQQLVQQHASDVSPGLWNEIKGVLAAHSRPAS
jgi:protein-tyrosine phosphatase